MKWENYEYDENEEEEKVVDDDEESIKSKSSIHCERWMSTNAAIDMAIYSLVCRLCMREFGTMIISGLA